MTTRGDVGHSPLRGRGPLVIAAVVPLAVVLALPWTAVELPQVPGFASVWVALLVAADLLTVLLLHSHYRVGGSPRLLPLSWAFMWSAGAAMQIAVAAPGVLTAEPSFASDPDSLAWLWLSRHLLPPLLIALALAPWPAAMERRFSDRDGRAVRMLLSWVLLALAMVVIALGVEALPAVTGADGRLDAPWVALVIGVNVAALVVAAWGVARRSSRYGLEAWAVVASAAFLGDVWMTTLTEDPFTLAYYLARFFGLAGAAFVMLAILHDTSRQQARTIDAAHRLELQNAQLLEAQRLHEHITAVVSHDLRTPLTGLRGYLELLRDDELDTPLARRMLERSWVLTRRLTLLTEDLLAAAISEHGELVVDPRPLDLGQQLAECASCFPDLDVRIECPPGLVAHADPLRLQQVLGNLVRNAQKHGAEPVHLSAASDPPRPGGTRIEVSDAGPGVPEAFVPRLFERYTQGTATAKATGGAGLGLSVVRDLVTAHRGTVHYDPATNAFVVTLPPSPAPTAEMPVLTVPAHTPAADGDRPRRTPHRLRITP